MTKVQRAQAAVTGPVGQGGFTLVEVLVATAIMVAVLGYLYFGTVFVMRSLEKSNKTLGAAAVMRNAISSFKATGELPDDDDVAGYIVSLTDDGAVTGTLRRHTITVSKRSAANPSVADAAFTPLVFSFYWKSGS